MRANGERGWTRLLWVGIWVGIQVDTPSILLDFAWARNPVRTIVLRVRTAHLVHVLVHVGVGPYRNFLLHIAKLKNR